MSVVIYAFVCIFKIGLEGRKVRDIFFAVSITKVRKFPLNIDRNYHLRRYREKRKKRNETKRNEKRKMKTEDKERKLIKKMQENSIYY